MKLVGYHGTSIESANEIMNSSFIPSDENNWLGKGVYFFEELEGVFNGKELAEWWCKDVKKMKSYSIIEAEVESDNICDMIYSTDDKQMFNRLLTMLYDRHISAGLPKEEFTPSVVYNIIGQNVDFIRSIVEGKNYTYTQTPRTYAIVYPQSQICVCNNFDRVISVGNKEDKYL